MGLARHGRFALLIAGTALNAIGSWATLIAVWGFATTRFHAGADQIALLGGAWALPGVLIGPFAGVPIDRVGPKRVLIVANVAGAGVSLALAGAHSFSTLAVLALAVGAVTGFAQPAAMSLPPRLVDDDGLLQANSLLGAAEQSAIVLGPLVAAAVISGWGARAPFFFDAATFVVGAATLVPLHLRPLAPAGRESPFREVRRGVALAWSIAEVRQTLTVATVVFFSWGAFFVLEPLYVRDVLHRSPVLLGLFQSAFGVGLIGATLVLPKIGDRVASVPALAASVVGSGVAAGAYVGTRSVAVAFVGVFVWGVCVGFFFSPMQTLLQRATPTEAHGRVLALSTTLEGAGNMAGIPAAGIVIGAVGVRATGVGVGLLALGAGVVGLLRAQPRIARRSDSPASTATADGTNHHITTPA